MHSFSWEVRASVSPLFFMSYKTARRNETRVVSSHRHYINFKLFTLISADMPTTIESRSLRCNFFNLVENTTPPACRRCSVRGTLRRYRESYTLRSRQNVRPICCRPKRRDRRRILPVIKPFTSSTCSPCYGRFSCFAHFPYIFFLYLSVERHADNLKIETAPFLSKGNLWNIMYQNRVTSLFQFLQKIISLAAR